MVATTKEKELVTTEVPERDGKAIEGKDMEPEMARIAIEEERRRDMTDGIADIDSESRQEIMIADTSPPRPMTILYATLDGEPIPMTRKRTREMLQRKLPDGRRMFAVPNPDGSKPAHLPEYREGSVKCFMHPGSEEREELDHSLGMAGKECDAGHLANIYAKRIHERTCHKREKEMYQGFLDDKKEAEAIERQEKMYEAMIAVAQSNQPSPVDVQTCNNCGVAIEGKLADHNCQEG